MTSNATESKTAGEGDLTNDSRFMDQYSRQIGAYGLETMGRLITLDILVVGMRGVGIECAKNLCLAGPRSITVCDPNPAFVRDLGSNFFLTEENVGKPRGECVAAKLAELNSMVAVRSLEALTEDAVKTMSAVVFTNGSFGNVQRHVGGVQQHHDDGADAHVRLKVASPDEKAGGDVMDKHLPKIFSFCFQKQG